MLAFAYPLRVGLADPIPFQQESLKNPVINRAQGLPEGPALSRTATQAQQALLTLALFEPLNACDYENSGNVGYFSNFCYMSHDYPWMHSFSTPLYPKELRSAGPILSVTFRLKNTFQVAGIGEFLRY